MVSEHGKCILSVPLSSLFAGNTVLFAHSQPFKHFTALKQVNVRLIVDDYYLFVYLFVCALNLKSRLQVIVKISLNKPLMSESLSRELCPMKLNIVKSKNNPHSPGLFCFNQL